MITLCCPVCGTNCGNEKQCPTCGFDQLDKEFVNKEDYQYWVDTVVKTCQSVYNTTKAHALRHANARELRDALNHTPPIDYYMMIESALKLREDSNSDWLVGGRIRKHIYVGLKVGVLSNSDGSINKLITVEGIMIGDDLNSVEKYFPNEDEDIFLCLSAPQEIDISPGMMIV